MKIKLGYTAHTLSTKVPFYFDLDPKQFRHGLVIGKTGTGKSTLLKHIFAAAAQIGWGILLLDPHGDLADAAFSYIPRHRIDDVILFDPENDHIPGIGLLDHPNKDIALRMAMTFFEAHSAEGWGKQTASFFRAFTRAALELFEHPTVIEIYNLMSDYKFGKAMLAKSKNPRTLKFWEQYYLRMKEKDFVEKCSHPLNKLEELIEPGIVEFLGQANSLNFRKLMDDSKIVICRIPDAFLGTRGMQVLGSIVMMKYKVDASRRKNRNKPVLIIPDEYHNFAKAINNSAFFGESRKFGIHVISTTQTRAQLKEIADIIDGNASHIWAFRMNAEDALTITENLGDDALDKRKLVKIGNYKFRALTMFEDEPHATDAVLLLDKPQLYRNLVPARKAHARASQNSGPPIKEVQKDINQRLAYPA